MLLDPSQLDWQPAHWTLREAEPHGGMRPSPRVNAILWHAGHAILLLALLALPLFVRGLLTWPYYLAVPLLLYAGMALSFGGLRGTYPRLRLGRMRSRMLLDTLGLSIATAALLALAYVTFRLDFSVFRRAVPHWPLRWLVLSGIVVAAINAFLEELVFRGIVFESVLPALGVRGAVLFSSLAFAVAHVYFVPNTLAGMLLAFCFGLTVGRLRVRSGGLALPTVLHFAADLTLVVIFLTPVPW
jgi:membrane protease YdiL (CAAX protease family)